MTLEAILKNVLAPSTSSRIYHRPTGNEFFAERTGGDFYGYGHYHKHKGKSKSDKKQAILSALSLLAFLFFLNVLQNCIRDQSEFTGSVFMFGHGKTTVPADEYKANEKRIRRGSESGSFGTLEKKEEEENRPNIEIESDGGSRKSRNLLQVDEKEISRRKKFISDLKNESDWTNEMSQMTDKDLHNQKLKTLVFPLYWKNNRLESKIFTNENSRMKENKNLRKIEKIIPMVLKKIKKREKSAEEKESKKANLTSMPPVLESSHNQTNDSSLTPTSPTAVETTQVRGNTSTTESYQTTVRYVRSEKVKPDSEKGNDQDTSAAQPTETAFGYHTYPHYSVEKYHNHRADYVPPGSNRTSGPPRSTIPPKIRNESRDPSAKETGKPPGHYSKANPPHHRDHHHHGKLKHWENVRPNHKKVFHKEGNHPLIYRHSPYRRVGIHHHGNLRPVVVAKHPVGNSSNFDLIRFALTLLTSLARPFAKLMPAFKSEGGSDEPRCYELMMCEGQRVSKFMGPTAETFAATLGTMLTWAAEEETRPTLMEAIKSGKKNTCRQQIKDCEEKSGGKSAMTVLAQFLETNALNK